MEGFPDLQKITKILADQSRLEILTILMDGKFHTVNELAKTAKIKSHTASYHLKQLYQLGWITAYKQGRNVYYSLCSKDVADLLEKLMSMSPTKKIQSFNKGNEYQKISKGRSCYRHLAGKMGVSFFNYLIQNQYVILKNNNLLLTNEGIHYFESIGVKISEIKKRPGIFLKPCLDWTERTFHLGGNLGRAFFDLCDERNFIVSNANNRSVCLTNAGEIFFHHLVFNYDSDAKTSFRVVLVGSQKLLYRKEVFIAKAFLTPTSKNCGLFNVVTIQKTLFTRFIILINN